MRFITPILCLICSTTFGQIKLNEQTAETWSGFNKPIINNDGTITTSAGSKPILSNRTTKYEIVTAIPYKFGLLEVYKIPSNEKVQLDKETDKELYWFRSGAVSGKYRFDYIAFDPDKGILKDSFEVQYNNVLPPPVNPVEPVLPDLGGLSLESNKVFTAYIKSMANDQKTLAQEFKEGKFKTVIDYGTRANVLDLATRTNFKQSMAVIMKPLLGVDILPPNTDLILLDIYTGFGGVK